MQILPNLHKSTRGNNFNASFKRGLKNIYYIFELTSEGYKISIKLTAIISKGCNLKIVLCYMKHNGMNRFTVMNRFLPSDDKKYGFSEKIINLF